jgi:signal transduction histidine kinase
MTRLWPSQRTQKQGVRIPVARESEATRLRERFERLLSASAAMLSEHSLAPVLQQVVDAARDVVGARYAALGVVGPDGTSLTEFVTSGVSEAEPRGQGLLGLVIREGKPIRVPNIGRHPMRAGFPAHHPPMTSFLGVPVAAGGRVFGNLYLADKIGAPEFSDEDERIAVLLAGQAAVAVSNAELVGELRSLQRQRDLFFAMMNHELRNALTGVYGWADRMIHARAPDATRQAGREVYEAAERTIELLNNLLDLSRLDAGKLRPVWREVDPRAPVERAIAGLRPAAEAKRLRIEASYPEPPRALRTDTVRLEQILVNLLSNAIRHSPDGAAIEVTIAEASGEVLFHVSDRGPGIAAELQDQIFEPFERLEASTGVGTGLGLPVSRRLAELLGGRLTVSSEPGRGATFTLALPGIPPKA